MGIMLNSLTKQRNGQVTKIATWKANELFKYSQEIKTFIFSQNNIDIFWLVSETHFINKNYYCISRYTLYNIIHSDGKAYGETFLIIRSIRHYEIDKFQIFSQREERENSCRLLAS